MVFLAPAAGGTRALRVEDHGLACEARPPRLPFHVMPDLRRHQQEQPPAVPRDPHPAKFAGNRNDQATGLRHHQRAPRPSLSAQQRNEQPTEYDQYDHRNRRAPKPRALAAQRQAERNHIQHAVNSDHSPLSSDRITPPERTHARFTPVNRLSRTCPRSAASYCCTCCARFRRKERRHSPPTITNKPPARMSLIVCDTSSTVNMPSANIPARNTTDRGESARPRSVRLFGVRAVTCGACSTR